MKVFVCNECGKEMIEEELIAKAIKQSPYYKRACRYCGSLDIKLIKKWVNY